MESGIVKFIVRLLCETLGGEKTEEAFKAIVQAAGDLKQAAAYIGTILGIYDPQEKALTRKYHCIDFSKVLGMEADGEKITIDVEPPEVIEGLREKAFEVFSKNLERESFQRIADAVRKYVLNPHEAMYLMSQLENLRKLTPYIEDFSIIPLGNELHIAITYVLEEYAIAVERSQKPGVFTFIYATLWALANGYSGVRFKKVSREGKTVIAEFELV